MNRTPDRLPRLARWVVHLTVPSARRDDIVGDLEEGLRRRRARSGRGQAAAWIWFQVVLISIRLPLARLRRTTVSTRPPIAGSVTGRNVPWRVQMESLVGDMRYALRTLRRNPMFTSVAVVTIALGIGANTAIFSVVQAVLLRPLPYAQPADLVMVWGELTARDVQNFPSSLPVLGDLRARSTQLEEVAGVVTNLTALNTTDGPPEQIQAAWVTENFNTVLGTAPVLGRDFTADDAVPAGPSVPLVNQEVHAPTAALVSHSFWRRRFGGDASVLGEIVRLDGSPVEIVGIMPPGFRLLLPAVAGVPSDIDVWLALRADYEAATPINVLLSVIGRLGPGATLASAQADLDRLASAWRDRVQVYNTAGFELRAVPLLEDLTADARPMLIALLGSVGFVLLIACANVSNLLLVRATGRHREMAVRAAIGGGRARLVRQLLTESLALAALGGALGLALAAVGIDVLLAVRPENLPRADTIGVDGWVLGFTAAASIVAALLFGVAPALQISRPQLTAALRQRGGNVDGRHLWTRDAVVVAEIALSVVLLMGAGLMVRSFISLQRLDPGFNPDAVVTFTLNIPATEYPDPAERSQFARRLQDRLEGIPGVSRASATFPLPLKDVVFWGRYGNEEAQSDPSKFKQANYRLVLPGYLDVMQTRLLAGRPLDEADWSDARNAVLVDEILAERMWPGESAVGKRLLVRLTAPEPVWVDVVGVVENQRHTSLAEPGRETIYFLASFVGINGPLSWTVRTAGEASGVVDQIRAEVRALDPGMPVADVARLGDYVTAAMGPTRFALSVIGVFGAIALTLASVGLYGVLAYTVRQRTTEIGIRMAFGAAANHIIRLIVVRGVILAMLGVGLGVVAALGVTRAMTSLLVGVAPADPLALLATAFLATAVAALACLLPARRATRVDPLVALRQS